MSIHINSPCDRIQTTVSFVMSSRAQEYTIYGSRVKFIHKGCHMIRKTIATKRFQKIIIRQFAEINGYGDFRLTGVTITLAMYTVHLARFNFSRCCNLII